MSTTQELDHLQEIREFIEYLKNDHGISSGTIEFNNSWFKCQIDSNGAMLIREDTDDK